MDRTNLMQAMIERCRESILAQDHPSVDLPKPLQSTHLIWMCDRLTEHISSWRPEKLNRWVGFIQCAMIANRMIDLDRAKRMFDEAKNAFGETGQDLTDHLDPDDSFELEIGGEG